MPAKRRRASKLPAGLSRAKNSEKIITKNLLNGFVAKGSRGELLIEEIICHKINEVTLPAIIQVSKVISELIGVELNRNHKRSKKLLVKWFQDNEEQIAAHKNNFKIVFYDQNDT